MKKSRADAPVEEGFQKGNILAGYAHLHLPSRPAALEYFINTCARKPADEQ
jgi:cobyrinic acid a,c-diamide synthase